LFLLDICRSREQRPILIGNPFCLGYLQIWGAENHGNRELFSLDIKPKLCFICILAELGAENYPHGELFFSWIFADLGSRKPELCLC
jgi:hypothetical protein